jgi:two-component system nitrate/nitrite response regulator NarL
MARVPDRPVPPVDDPAPAPVRVVVADDHDGYRRGLVRAIRRFGALRLVGEAADGAQALSLIRERAPDVALLDVRMPGLDGVEVARRLRDEERVDVLLLTGSVTSALRAVATEVGARALLSKDLSRDEICRRLLSRR